MARLRTRLSWLASFWLFCQVAGFVAAPVVFAVSKSMIAAEEDCECPGTLPGQACPMHKGHDETREDETQCGLRNGCTPSDAALLTICGSIGVVPRLSSVAVDRTPDLFAELFLAPIARADLPDAPPPRA